MPLYYYDMKAIRINTGIFKCSLVICGAFLLLRCGKDEPKPDCNTLAVALATATPPSTCSANNGSLTFSVTGGTAPYRFELNTGSTLIKQNSSSFNGQFAGKFELTVTDANACTTISSFELRLPVASGAKFSTDVKPILDKSCNIATCHDGSLGADRDWRNLSAIKKKLNNFQRILLLKKMPPPPNALLPDADVEKILCWIADGAPEN